MTRKFGEHPADGKGLERASAALKADSSSNAVSLVSRLREDADAWEGPHGDNTYSDTVLVEREAANEIERLTRALRRTYEPAANQAATIARLRAALEQIARPGDFTLPAEIARAALEYS